MMHTGQAGSAECYAGEFVKTTAKFRLNLYGWLEYVCGSIIASALPCIRLQTQTADSDRHLVASLAWHLVSPLVATSQTIDTSCGVTQ